MGGRTKIVLTVVAATLALGAAPAQADHHLVRIAEVFAGGEDESLATVEYVQLQMTSAGQNLFAGTGSTVTLFAEDGGSTGTQNIPGDYPNGERGRRVLLGAQGMEALFPSANDAPDVQWIPGDYLSPAGGAACFTSGVFGPIDCVSWGAFNGVLPSPTGGNAPALTSPDTLGFALIRRTPPCGGGLIDTNSPGNLTTGSPDPQNNSAPAATGDPCPNTTITKKPPKRTTKARARFAFTSSINPATFRCKLDSAPYRACDSPYAKRVKRGRHTFRVKANAGGATDPTPASYSWRRV